MEQNAQLLKVGIDQNKAKPLKHNVHQQLDESFQNLNKGKELIQKDQHDLMDKKEAALREGMVRAQKNVILTEKLPRTWGLHNKGE